MATTTRRSNYYYATVRDEPGEGYRLLHRLAGLGVNLLAFTAVPVGPRRTQFALFPEDEGKLARAAGQAGIGLDGPFPALVVMGDDELGLLARIHEQLLQAGVNVYASSAVTDGDGHFGCVLYLTQDHVDRAAAALGI